MDIKIGQKTIGEDKPTYLILEIARTYNDDLATAQRMMEAAAKYGADAIKIQTIFASELMVETLQTKDYYAFLKTLERSEKEHLYLKKEAEKLGLEFLSTPEGFQAVDLLERVGVRAYKISSLDLVYWDLLRYIAQKGKPVILSTGMAETHEIQKAVEVIRSEGNNQIILLHCVSTALPKPQSLNLNTIPYLMDKFGLTVGFSDHTLDLVTPLVAVSLGAKVIEKHFTLDRKQKGGDHFISIIPEELKTLVKNIRMVEKMLGVKNKVLSAEELTLRQIKRRKIVAARDISKNTIITKQLINCRQTRTNDGIDAAEINIILGKKLLKNTKKDEIIEKTDLGK